MSSLDMDQTECYEIWDVEIPSIPPRSRLYSLEPIGIGTPYVESLTSYIARLAEAHHIIPKVLVVEIILPLLGQSNRTLKHYYRLNRFWNGNASTLNSISTIAVKWVDVLQSLTTCNKLRFLTMLMWKDVFAINQLLRPQYKAWCSQCYQEWHESNQIIYEPLLWLLNDVNVCLYHQIPLNTRCSHCQRNLPYLAQSTRPGYCSYCCCWLGHMSVTKSSKDLMYGIDEYKRQCWVARVSGDLLAAAPSLSVQPPKEQIALKFGAFLDNYTDGKNGCISVLARLLEIEVTTLWQYLNKYHVPLFSSLLKICYTLSTTPLEFLTSTTIPPRDSHFVVESIPVVSRGKWITVTENDIGRMRQVLETILTLDHRTDPFPSLEEIATNMGYDSETVRKHCPDLSKAIILRRGQQWANDSNRMRIKQALESALNGNERKPLKDIARQLGCDTSILYKYFPDFCNAVVARYRERFDYAMIERRLYEVLGSKEETPSVYELAHQMGYERHVIKDKFPGLCKQISARRYAERRRRREERMTKIGEEIRWAILQLHQQGIYPSARQVVKIMDDPHALRTKEGHEAWRLTLQELGYPTDKLRSYD